jgi:hypothetical protein
VLSQPGKPPTRGFGGRIFFYNNHAQAIPVKGTLTVYGFDDTHPRPKDAARQPDLKCVFKEEQFEGHFSSTQLGASYSVWVPWDRLGSPQKTITLLPVFTLPDGRRISGAQTSNILVGDIQPGMPVSVSPASYKTEEGSNILTAAYEKDRQERGLGVKTTTIDVPLRTSQRWAEQAAAPSYSPLAAPANTVPQPTAASQIAYQQPIAQPTPPAASAVPNAAWTEVAQALAAARNGLTSQPAPFQMNAPPAVQQPSPGGVHPSQFNPLGPPAQFSPQAAGAPAAQANVTQGGNWRAWTGPSNSTAMGAANFPGGMQPNVQPAAAGWQPFPSEPTRFR